MEIEGIILQVVPFKERDLIFKLLTRNGEVASLFNYGGQGGGKSFRPRLIQQGFLIKSLHQVKKKGLEESNLMIVSDIQVKWEPLHIRHNVEAYYLQSYFLEVILKIAPSFHPDHSFVNENESLFNVLSNALFYSDQSLKNNDFKKMGHLFLFTVKTLFHSGLAPDGDYCVVCSDVLLDESYLHIKEGGFCCPKCMNTDVQTSPRTRFWLREALTTKYQDYQKLNNVHVEVLTEILQFFFYHNQMNPLDIKSKSLVF